MWIRWMLDGAVHSIGNYYGGQAGNEYGPRDDITASLEMVECYSREFRPSNDIIEMTNECISVVLEEG